MKLSDILCDRSIARLEEIGVDVETLSLTFTNDDLCRRCEARLTAELSKMENEPFDDSRDVDIADDYNYGDEDDDDGLSLGDVL